jgi:hypothetical protein
MGRFTQTVDKVAKFDGEEVHYTLRRMQNKHMLKLAPLFSDPVQREQLLFRTARMVEEAQDVLKECVAGVFGYSDSTGKPTPFDVMLSESYFLPLLDEMVGELWKVSVMTEVDAKKSAATPPASSSAASPAGEPSPGS